MSHRDDMVKLFEDACPKFNETPARMTDLLTKLGCIPESVMGGEYISIVSEMERSGDVRWSNDDKGVPCIQLSARWEQRKADQTAKAKERKEKG